MDFLVLAETCNDPLDLYGEATPTPDTAKVTVTDRIVYPSLYGNVDGYAPDSLKTVGEMKVKANTTSKLVFCS